jgi:hypothetical protein
MRSLQAKRRWRHLRRARHRQSTWIRHSLNRSLAPGQANGGVYQFNVPRREPVKENDMVMAPVGPMGVAIAISFQPTGGDHRRFRADQR